MSSIENANKIIFNWKQKGDNETNNFDKFICYWIAFNAWYSSNLYPRPDSKGRIYESGYIEEVKKHFKRYETEFINEIESAKNLNPKLKNVTRRDLEVTVSDISSLIDFIYTVRNNLFHGNKIDSDQRDNEVLKIATPILLKILNKTL